MVFYVPIIRTMTRILTTCLFAGGTGKTTTAVTIAAAIAHIGKRVLLIDCDTQNDCAKFLGSNHEGGLFQLVTAGTFEPIELRPNLHLLTGGNESISQLKNHIGNQTRQIEKVLSKAIKPVAAGFDYVILDSPPSYDRLTENIFHAADEIIAPVICEPKGLNGLVSFVNQLAITQEDTPIKIRYIVPTRYDARTAQSKEIYQQLADTFGDVVTEPIRIDVRLSDSVSYGQTIWEYDETNERSAADYSKLIQRILNDG
jgi:chromosome partitioning protein